MGHRRQHLLSFVNKLGTGFVRKRGKKKNVTKAKEYFLFREKPINSIAGIINYQHRSLMNTKGKKKKGKLLRHLPPPFRLILTRLTWLG